MKVNKNSWHARIVHFPMIQFDDTFDKCRDFCDYTRWFLWKLLVVIPLICLFIGGILGMYVGGLIGFLNTGDYIFDSALGIINFIVSIVVVAVFTIIKGYQVIANYQTKQQNNPTKEPGFIATWYSKWKDKFCPAIRYDND